MPWCGANRGRREHAEASAELAAIGAEISEQLKLLDGVVEFRFGGNADLMGGWASARNVLGPFKSKQQPPADGGGSQTPKAA